MADLKISNLPSATTPLAGTEVLPIVQSGATVQVSNNNLRPLQIQSNATSGVLQVAGPSASTTRVMTTPDANFTVARLDGSQTFTAAQTISAAWGSAVALDIVASGGASNATLLIDSSSGNGYGSYAKFKSNTTGGTTNTWVVGTGITGSANSFEWYVSGSASDMLLDTSGNLTLNAGNIIASTSGNGIQFGSSTVLSDYEEGTWTPSIQGTTTAGTVSYSNNAGRYTKVGRQVFVEAYIDWYSGTGTGYLIIANLPYTATNVNYYRPGVAIGYLYGVTLATSNLATGWIDKNSSHIELQQYPVGGGTSVTDVNYSASGRISFGAVYTV